MADCTYTGWRIKAVNMKPVIKQNTIMQFAQEKLHIATPLWGKNNKIGFFGGELSM